MKIPIFKNTLTNYLISAVRLIQGVLITRWIIAYMGMETYGLWALLWTFFVYGVLLDFGCGAAAQKYTASGIYNKDPDKYTRIISTIFSFHLMMGGVIALIVVGLSFFSDILFKLPPGPKLDYARTCFLLFGFGAALVFPTGMFTEILVGLQKLYVRNVINVITKCVELLFTLLIFYFDGTLIALIIVTMVLNIASNIVMGYFGMRDLPKARCKILIDKECWKEIFTFSGFVYLGSISRLLLNKSSRLMISMFCGIVDVGLFNVSSRVGDLCGQVAGQYQENIGPISGALHKRNHNAALRRILFNAFTFNSVISFILMLCAFILIEPILIVLFNIPAKYPDAMPIIVLMSRLFIINMYISITLRSIPQTFMLMADRHKLATIFSIVEGVLTLAVNIIVLALGAEIYVLLYTTLVVTGSMYAFIILPYMLKYMQISFWYFFWNVYGRVFLSGIVPTLYLLTLLHFLNGYNWLCCIFGSGGALLLYIVGYILLTPRTQRHQVLRKVARKFPMARRLERWV